MIRNSRYYTRARREGERPLPVARQTVRAAAARWRQSYQQEEPLDCVDELYGIVIVMKAIQITLDDALLARLDADEEVRREGRSAVLRRAADEYLRKRRKRAIATQYAKAYGSSPDLDEEFSGWEDEGAWPER